MAQQTKAEDPIAAAMSAIEDALNLSHGDAGVDVARPPRAFQPPQAKPPETSEAKPVAPPSPADKPGLTPQRSTGQAAPALKPGSQLDAGEARPILASSSPANDDRPSAGQILQAMQPPPPRRAPFIPAI